MMKQELTRIYLKYKKQLVPTILVSASLFILLRIIFPQITELSETGQEIERVQREIEDLNATLSTVSAFNSVEGEGNIALTTKALPNSKDISVIFSLLTGVASESNVEIRDFSLTIGGLYGRAAAGTGARGVPVVDVKVRFEAPGSQTFVALAEDIQTRLPLVEIQNVEISGNQGTFELGFYYKPIDLAALAKQGNVRPLTQADLNLINQLRTWDE